VKKLVVDAFRAACARVDLAGRVCAAIGDAGPFVVIAAGKAAAAMASGVANVERALVVVPRGTAVAGALGNVIEASHPLPDASSVRAAEAALAMAACDSPYERLFLISGGASSLLCAPVDGLTLERKREITSELLRSGASIDAINVVRRHLSRVKGGGLARACGTNERRTLLVSDVISNELEAIGSGPSVADPTTVDAARRVANAYGLGTLPFVETWKEDERAELVATPLAFAKLVAEELVARGVTAHATTMPAWLDAESMADRYEKIAPMIPRGEAGVFAAEPVVRVTTPNARGGRCTHMAALMSQRLPAHAIFAAIATDGVDGSSGTGGAIVDDSTLLGVDFAIASFATGPLHVAAGTAIPSGATGINFADVHVLLRT
jgi:hydroxypyruvate reductase